MMIEIFCVCIIVLYVLRVVAEDESKLEEEGQAAEEENSGAEADEDY